MLFLYPCLNTIVLDKTFLIDISFRTQVNAVIITNFYLYWTHLWYICLFILLLVGSNLFWYTHSVRQALLLLYLITLVIMYSIYSEFYLTNTSTFTLSYMQEHLNPLLKNSLNKIHPLILYLVGIKFISVNNLRATQSSRLSLITEKTFFLKIFYALLLLLTCYISTTLYLGSWWALQEGSWGGWWNWDTSEFFGLFLLIRCLLLWHYSSNMSSGSYLKLSLSLVTNSILLFFLGLQLNFTSISHNFGFHGLRFINLYLLLLLCFLICLSYYLTLVLQAVKSVFYKKAFLCVSFYLTYVWITVIVVLCGLNLTILIKGGLLTLWAVNLPEVQYFEIFLSLNLFLFLWLYHSNGSVLNVLTLLSYLNLGSYLVVFLLKLSRLNIFLILHLAIFYFTLLNYYFCGMNLAVTDYIMYPDIYTPWTTIRYQTNEINFDYTALTVSTSFDTKILLLYSSINLNYLIHILALGLPKIITILHDAYISVFGSLVYFWGLVFIYSYFLLVIID